MNSLMEMIKLAAVISGAMILGRWFLQEVRSARADQAPWYAPYLSGPGILVFLVLLLPVFIRLMR
jgi:hypothetical protein